MQPHSVHHLVLILFVILSSSKINVMVEAIITSPADLSAIKAFKASIKPSSIPQGSCLASWDFTAADPCAQPRRTHFICGLTCSPDSTRITQLTLDSVGYSGELTPLISKLTNLVVLDLGDNGFHGSIPTSLSSLVNLQVLSLRSNSFSGSFPVSLAKLITLESLDLSRNSLTGNLPVSLNSLTKLRRLDLSYNKLTGSIPKLPINLLELALKGNSFSGELRKETFDGLTQLEVIELAENSFTGTLPSWFFKLPSLQQVDMANNSLTSVEISNGSGEELVAVELGFNKIEGYAPANIGGYPRLASLSMRYNRLRGGIPSEYSKSKSLRRLFLDGNFLNGNPPAGLIAGNSPVSGSLGNNCLQSCPGGSKMCVPSQKPDSVCKQAYGRH